MNSALYLKKYWLVLLVFIRLTYHLVLVVGVSDQRALWTDRSQFLRAGRAVVLGIGEETTKLTEDWLRRCDGQPTHGAARSDLLGVHKAARKEKPTRFTENRTDTERFLPEWKERWQKSAQVGYTSILT
jgi:hypothetical protein